ncbi:hypothetical protein PASE110613_14495 [Paenibacillus sediminis]|uniref:Uncharacterized protein n=1 Tax=Paenibacillus sediminis TaxID=664909 RepID=A0ABS4H7J8_9BACL|nr:hypothetical protein [Paenibacillus sediminis]
MVKVKKEVQPKSKFETKIPKMGVRELQMSYRAIRSLKLNSLILENPCKCKCE